MTSKEEQLKVNNEVTENYRFEKSLDTKHTSSPEHKKEKKKVQGFF